MLILPRLLLGGHGKEPNANVQQLIPQQGWR
jgi:hypothetical protein